MHSPLPRSGPSSTEVDGVEQDFRLSVPSSDAGQPAPSNRIPRGHRFTRGLRTTGAVRSIGRTGEIHHGIRHG